MFEARNIKASLGYLPPVEVVYLFEIFPMYYAWPVKQFRGLHLTKTSSRLGFTHLRESPRDTIQVYHFFWLFSLRHLHLSPLDTFLPTFQLVAECHKGVLELSLPTCCSLKRQFECPRLGSVDLY